MTGAEARSTTDPLRAGPSGELANAMLAAMVRASRDAILSVDAETGAIQTWNPGAEQIFGYRADEVIGRSIGILAPPDEPGGPQRLLERVRAGGSVHDVDTVRVRKDGSRVAVSVSIDPVFDAAGRVVSLAGVVRDITDRKRAEAARQRVEFRYQRLVEQAPLSTQVFAPDGTCRSVNRAWEQLWGFTLADIPNYNILADPQLIAHGVTPLMAKAFAGEAVTTPPIPYRPDRGRYAGQVRWCGASVFPVKDEQGRVEEVVLVHHDVTETKTAEHALRASEERLRALFEQSAAGIAQLDPGGRFIMANQWFCNLVGYTRDELLGLRMQDITHPDDLQRNVDQLEQAKSDGSGNYGIEKRYVRKDGSHVWASVSSNVLRDAAGQPQAILGVITDITARKQAEEQLRRNHDTFYHLIQNDPFGVYVVDADFRLRQASLGSQKVFANVRPLLGRDFAEVMRTVWAEPFATETIARFRHALETGEQFAAPSSVERRQDTGELEAYDWRIERLTLPDGRFGVVCYFYDLSERQRWEAALRESETRLTDQKEAFELAVSGAPIHDVLDVLVRASQRRFGPGARTSIFIVGADGTHLGFGAAAGLPETYTSAVDGVAIGAAGPSCALAAHTGEAVVAADVAADPRWAPFTHLAREHGIGACWSFPIRASAGKVIGTFTVYHAAPRAPDDRARQHAALLAQSAGLIIERHQAEDALRRAKDEAERASEAKSNFLGMLSHELRTPLTPVLLTVSLMETHPSLPDELREDVATIRRNVELESRLISDLLDLTRIEKGKLQLDVQDVDLHLIVRSAIDICQREASAKLSVDFGATRRTVRGDGTRLQQIFWNLVNNAIKFTGAGGEITVRTSDAPHDRIRVEVTDTGVGIDAAVLPQLFRAFEQGEARAARQQAGLGLGLTISKKLAEAHGGTITAVSAGRGRGATFTVELPIAATAAVASAPVDRPRPTALAPSAASPLGVLLVEDHAPTLAVMSRLLRGLGHRVTGATSVASAAAAAAAAAEAEPFDLVISDLGLPDGSGLDLIRQLGQQYAGRAVALTGYGMESDVRASLEAGFAAHLTKPVDFGALQAAIERLTANAR